MKSPAKQTAKHVAASFPSPRYNDRGEGTEDSYDLIKEYASYGDDIGK